MSNEETKQAAAEETSPMKLNIYQKIHAVMKDIEYLNKDDKIEFGNTKYKAISEEKVTSSVRQSLIKHGLVIIPCEQDHKRDDEVVKDKYGKEQVHRLSTVDVKYKIIDIDTGDYEIACSSGTGVDTQDKGVGKAMTYSYKYLLLRTFAIPTGEDPDKISSAELDDKLKKKDEKEGSPETSEDQIKQKTVGLIKTAWLALGNDAKLLNAQLKKLYKADIEGLTETQAQEFLKLLEEKKQEASGQKKGA